LKKTPGVNSVKSSFSKSTVSVTYDPTITDLGEIIDIIEKLDYFVTNKSGTKPVVANKSGNKSVVNSKNTKENGKMSISQMLGIAIIIIAGYMILNKTGIVNALPQINQNMGFGILFIVGLITSIHCVAMCGGINLSQCASYKFDANDSSKISKIKPSLMYNAGRVASYTILGGIFGAFGSIISISSSAKGIVTILAGVFMVIMGLNMLNIFPWLRKFNPRMPKLFGNKAHDNAGKHGPFYVGLLNGLMPCGPLQAMQIYALGTGSFLAGAGAMFFFSMGTVPLMFGFGAISSLLSRKFTHNMLKVSAMLVMALGIIMLNRGFNISGFTLFNNTAYASSSSGNVAKIEGGIQTVTTKLESGRYTPFTVQKGIPVRWTISADASQINGCNGTVTIPSYGISKTLQPGDNVIEFTPNGEGNVLYTCSMGMIKSNISVVADLNSLPAQTSQQSGNNNPTIAASSSGGCCGAAPAGFAGGKIPTDKIQLATISNKKQVVTITVNSQGYSPAVVVLQKGIPAVIKFKAEQLSSCNGTVVFPTLGGQLNLNSQTETPSITPTTDFTFQCGMGMLHGYVKVVDDISKVNLDDIRKQVQNYTPPTGSSGSGGCCG